MLKSFFKKKELRWILSKLTRHYSIPIRIGIGREDGGHVFRFHTIICQPLEPGIHAGVINIIPPDSVYEHEQHFLRISGDGGKSEGCRDQHHQDHYRRDNMPEKHLSGTVLEKASTRMIGSELALSRENDRQDRKRKGVYI